MDPHHSEVRPEGAPEGDEPELPGQRVSSVSGEESQCIWHMSFYSVREISHVALTAVSPLTDEEEALSMNVFSQW